MKRILVLIALVAAIVITGCHRNPNPAASKSKVDMVVLNNQGQMQFYNHATHQFTPYKGEKDPVVNMAFDHSNHLYYTVAQQQDLVLKVIDLSEKNPQPKQCADWQLTLDEITDFMYGTGPADIYMDGNMEHVYMMNSDMSDNRTIDVEVCDLASGTTKGLEWEAYSEQYSGAKRFPADHFYQHHGKLYYARPEGTVCLNDRIDFTQDFDEDEIVDLWFNALDLSPDGKKIVYSATVAIGEGWGKYCLASSDGQTQSVLSDSDIWKMTPAWLSDGSLVYVAVNGEGQATGIKMIAPDGTASLLAPGAKQFFINPADMPMAPVLGQQASLEGCDMAIFDNGKVSFYNSSNNSLIPLVVETDSVLDGVFWMDDVFYYTVAIGDELYLKRVYLAYSMPNPEMITDWQLKQSDCFVESCVRAPMRSNFDKPVVQIKYELDEDYCEFMKDRYYAIYEETVTDQLKEIDLGDVAEKKEIQRYLDEDLFKMEQVDVEDASEEEEGYESYYYYVPTPSDRVCISDKIDFAKLGGYYQPTFELRSVNPTRESVVYAAYTDWGHVGHGPLCYASLDGKVQMILNTESWDTYWGWLNDGRLAYADEEGVKVVTADGKETLLSTAKKLVTNR